jgi:hypothetical protein
MTDGQQVALAIAPTVLPTLTVLVAPLLNNRQFDSVNRRIDVFTEKESTPWRSF